MVIPSEMEQVVIAGKHLEEADGDLTVQIKEIKMRDAELICVNCPKGCRVTVYLEGDKNYKN